MPLVFLFYLLCAITDCPPPVVHDSSSGNSVADFVKTVNKIRRSSLADIDRSLNPTSLRDRRVARSHGGRKTSSIGNPVVSTALGEVEGRLLRSRNGREIAAFEGIPYALPPVNNLRFRNPVPVTKWGKRRLIANETQKDCLQIDFSRMFQVRGTEDCLHLSVYAPNAFIKKQSRRKALLPVLVYIHGGGWMSLSSSIYGPRYILDKDVILVKFNFRLGVLGFLSTGNADAHGNFGLRDQAVALKWVVDHIKDFGGDPKKITLMGESTGAGSAALHILSPLTSKSVTIQGAILLSGTSLNHWAIMNDTFQNTKALALRMGCPTEKSSELVECLRGKDPYMTVGQQLHLWMVPVISRLLFGPVVESPINNENPFLLEHPSDTYRFRRDSIKHVPVIAGITRDEGALFAGNAYLLPFFFRTINRNWNKLASYIMAYDRLPKINVQETSDKIANFYFNWERWSFNNRDKISQALGDRTIVTGVYKFLESHSQVAPTYGYIFSHESKHSMLRQMGLRNEEWGVSHADELPFIFSMDQVFDDLQDPKDLKVSEFLVDVVTNFAQNRQPSPNNEVSENVTWSPIINPKYNMQVLEITSKKSMIPFPFMKRMKFWESLNLL